MYPTLMVTSPVAAMIYINGAFAGEAAPDAPLIRPVGARGTVYLESRPLEAAYLPMARRAAFSAGELVPESVAFASGVSAVIWPNRLTEIELRPERVPIAAPVFVAIAGADASAWYVSCAGRANVTVNAAHVHALPEGARAPVIARAGARLCLSGDTDTGGRYVLLLSGDGAAARFTCAADEITFLEDGRIAARDAIADMPGYVVENIWAEEAGAYGVVSSRVIAPSGASRAQNAHDAALFALNALIFGLPDEASRLLAPGVKIGEDVLAACARAGAVARAGVNAEGEETLCLMALVSARVMRAQKIAYSARAGEDGGMLLTALRLCENTGE